MTFVGCAAPPSTCSRWFSATWATTAPPASPSRVIPPPAKTSSTENFSSTARAKHAAGAIRTPIPCEQMGEWSMKSWKEILKIKDVLEKRYKDVQDFEFTIEKGRSEERRVGKECRYR